MVNKLLDVPKDILLIVLYVCRVKDILAIEQTCSLLHDIVATRHLWLVQLHSLEQACAPDLPSYIDIEGLSYSDLRVLVVKAVRGYETCKKGLLISPETKRHTVMVETPLNSVNLSEHDDTFAAQLSPGGNYMILENRSRRYLQAFDVRSSRCVWTYPEAYSGNSSRNSMINVALEACTSTSLLVHAASMNFVSGTLTLEIFRFDYSERHETRVRKIAFFQSQSSRHRLSALHNVCLGGDFVVAFTSSNLIRAVIVWNWCSEQMMEVTFGRNIGIKDLKIMRDHLFYVLYNLNGGYILGSISLRRLEGLATSSVDLADVNTCSLELNPPAGFELGGISPVALCGLFKSDRMSAIRAAVILSVLSEGNSTGYVLFHMADHFVFDFQDADDGPHVQLTLKHRSKPVEPHFPREVHMVGCQFTTSMTRSGRVLVELQNREEESGSSRRVTSLIGLDMEGELYYTLLPDEVTKVTLESFSGALVKTDLSSHLRHVDIYYPA